MFWTVSGSISYQQGSVNLANLANLLSAVFADAIVLGATFSFAYEAKNQLIDAIFSLGNNCVDINAIVFIFMLLFIVAVIGVAVWRAFADN